MMPIRETNQKYAARLFLLSACSCLTAAITLGVAGCSSSAVPPRVPPPPPVTVVISRKMTLPVVVRPIGTTRALNDVTIRARVKGFLLKNYFDEGTNVKEGQELLLIDKEPYEIQLKAAKAQLAAAEAGLKKAKASKNVPVSKAKLELDMAQLSLDEIEERRARNLLARNAASQEDFDKARSQKAKSAAQVDSDKASLDEAVLNYDIDVENALAEVERARAAVENAALDLKYCRMKAPIDGRIGEIKVKLGNLVGDTSATELVNIQQLDPMGIDLRPPATRLPIATALQARGGIDVNVTVEGERPYPHVGKTIFVDNQVDVQTGTFLVRAKVDNPDGAILPGQYIKATLTIGQYVDAVVVPEQAVLEGQEGPRVYVVDADSKVQVTKVSPVDEYEGLRVLESGLESGQRVIVEGLQLVRQGQVVKVTEAPLDQFRHAAPAGFNADTRFTSKVTRLPGVDLEPSKTSPAIKQGEPEPRKPEPASPKGALDPAARPDERPSTPAEMKTR